MDFEYHDDDGEDRPKTSRPETPDDARRVDLVLIIIGVLALAALVLNYCSGFDPPLIPPP